MSEFLKVSEIWFNYIYKTSLIIDNYLKMAGIAFYLQFFSFTLAIKVNLLACVNSNTLNELILGGGGNQCGIYRSFLPKEVL